MEEGKLGKKTQSTRSNQTCPVSCRKTITALAFSPDGKYLVTGEVSEEWHLLWLMGTLPSTKATGTCSARVLSLWPHGLIPRFLLGPNGCSWALVRSDSLGGLFKVRMAGLLPQSCLVL